MQGWIIGRRISHCDINLCSPQPATSFFVNRISLLFVCTYRCHSYHFFNVNYADPRLASEQPKVLL